MHWNKIYNALMSVIKQYRSIFLHLKNWIILTNFKNIYETLISVTSKTAPLQSFSVFSTQCISFLDK